MNKKIIIVIVFVVVFIASGLFIFKFNDKDKNSLIPVDHAPTLQWSRIAGHSQDDRTLNDVIYASGKFVAVGDRGEILISKGGNKWRDMSTGSSRLNSIIYANGYFVTVGDHGEILTSKDGVSWKIEPSITSANLEKIIYGKNLYVVLGTDSRLYTSKDAIHWTSNPLDYGGNIRSIAYDKQFLVVGDGGIARVSKEAKMWSHNKSTSSNDSFNDVINYDGEFYAIAAELPKLNGLVLTSANGHTWTRLAKFKAIPHKVSLASDKLVICFGQSIAMKQINSENWKVQSVPNQDVLNSVAYGKGIYVGVGYHNVIYTSNR